MARLAPRLNSASVFLLGNVLMGINVPLAKFALAAIALGPFLIIRHLFAGIFLALIAKRHGEWRTLSWSELKSIGWLGLIGISVANALFYFGMTLVPSTHVLLVVLTMPVMVYGLSSLILKETLDRQALIGTLVSLVGVVTLIVGQLWHEGAAVERISGMAILLLAILASAFAVVRAKKVLNDIEPIQVAALQLIIGSLPFIIWWGNELISFDWSDVAWRYLLAFLMVVLVVTPLSFLAFYKGLKSVSVKSSVGYIYFQTLAGDLLAVSIFSERLTRLYIVSMVIVVVGIWIGRAPFGRVWPEYTHHPLIERLRWLGQQAFHWHRRT